MLNFSTAGSQSCHMTHVMSWKKVDFEHNDEFYIEHDHPKDDEKPLFGTLEE